MDDHGFLLGVGVGGALSSEAKYDEDANANSNAVVAPPAVVRAAPQSKPQVEGGVTKEDLDAAIEGTLIWMQLYCVGSFLHY